MERGTAWDHLQVACATVEEVGRPLAYSVDHHRIFRYGGIPVATIATTR